MQRTLLCLLAAGCLAVTGCSSNHYQVRVTPTDSGFERTLKCWVEDTGENPNRQSLNSADLVELESCYQSPPRLEKEAVNVFHGKFTTETPRDVGGAGRLERIDTSLGTLWLYVERFRGNDDLEEPVD